MAKLVFILFLSALLLAAFATYWRVSSRSAQALRDFPPTGRFLTIDGSRVHYRQEGSGPDLVLIHGASGNLRDFDFGLLADLSSRYRVTVFDRPGLGHSTAIADASIAAQVHLLRAASDVLGIRQPLVVGHSYGGALALDWALQGGAAGIVLISSPSLPWPGKLDPWYRVNANFAGRALAPALVAAWIPASYPAKAIDSIFEPDPVPEGYAQKIGPALTIRAPVLRTNAAQINALRAQLNQMQQDYPRLTLPVGLIHGDADVIVPLTIHSGPLSAMLPNAELVVLPGVGHMPHHANLPAVIKLIDDTAKRAGLR